MVDIRHPKQFPNYAKMAASSEFGASGLRDVRKEGPNRDQAGLGVGQSKTMADVTCFLASNKGLLN